MYFNKRILGVLIIFIAVMFVSSSVAYTGTGFTHNIPDNYYDSYSADELLNKYNDTYLTSEERSVCTKVVDGDTIYLSNGKKVRFVGVNTPEKGVVGYQASKRFVKKLCLNKEVGINIDDKKYTDKYGRTLAVVIVDGKNLNEMLLKEGLAEVMYIPPSEFSPYSWTSDGLTTADTMPASNIVSTATSLENSSTSNEKVSSGDSSKYIGNSNSHKFHKENCKAVKKMSENNKVYFNSRDDAINDGYVACKMCNP